MTCCGLSIQSAACELRNGPLPRATEGNACHLSTPSSPASINSYTLDHKHRTVCPNASFKNTKIPNRAYRTTPASSVAPQHAVHQVSQRAPEVLAGGQVVLVDEEHVLLEAGVEVGLEAELADD